MIKVEILPELYKPLMFGLLDIIHEQHRTIGLLIDRIDHESDFYKEILSNYEQIGSKLQKQYEELGWKSNEMG